MSDQTREQPGDRDYHRRFVKGSAAARKAGKKGGSAYQENLRAKEAQ